MKAILLLISLAQGDAVAASPGDTSIMRNEALSGNRAAIVQAAVPSYAKWGRLAMQETAKAYEGASIVDYKYEGRSESGQGLAEEKFRLWLKQDGREFGVRVTITVDTATDRSRGVRLDEIRP